MSSSSPAPSWKWSQQMLEGGRFTGWGLCLSKYGGIVIVHAAMRLVIDVAVWEASHMPVGEPMLGLEPALCSVDRVLCQVGRSLFTQQRATKSSKIQAESSVGLPMLWLWTESQNSMIFMELFIRVTRALGLGSCSFLVALSHLPLIRDTRTPLHELSLSISVPLFFCIQQLDAQVLWNVKH